MGIALNVAAAAADMHGGHRRVITERWPPLKHATRFDSPVSTTSRKKLRRRWSRQRDHSEPFVFICRLKDRWPTSASTIARTVIRGTSIYLSIASFLACVTRATAPPTQNRDPFIPGTGTHVAPVRPPAATNGQPQSTDQIWSPKYHGSKHLHSVRSLTTVFVYGWAATLATAS